MKSSPRKLAQRYYEQGDHIKALEVIEDSILKIGGKLKLPSDLCFLQGHIFMALARKTENSDLKFAFFLASVECYLEDYMLQAFGAVSLFHLGERLGSTLYYKKAVKIAKRSLSVMSFDPSKSDQQKTKRTLEDIVETTGSRIIHGLTVKSSEPKLKESQEIRIKIRSDSHTIAAKRLRLYWAGMSAERKRNFMKVSTVELRSYVERVYGREGLDALEQVLDSARINRKWKFWMCRTCSQTFFYPKKFKNHLEQVHDAKYKPVREDLAQSVDDVWAGMISVADWEPVDALAAAEMIKNRLEFVKEFVYVNGWSKDWPLAADEERRKLLKEIRLLLVLLLERKILSCSIRDWMMRFPVKHLIAQFEVSENTITTECRLVETPQSICFLECDELNQILDLLKRIKCERDDGTELISMATDSLWRRTQVKEKIDIDHECSLMLLDKRLLRGKIASFDDEGSIDVCDHNVHYAKTHPQGNDIITWLLDDYSLIDKSFGFPRSIGAHNLDIRMAVLRAIHFTRRTLATRYAKKWQILCYDECLNDARNLCIQEDESRMNVPEDQRNIYASLLCDSCEEQLTIDTEDPLFTELYLCAVRDVLEGASHPTFDFTNAEDCLELIHGLKNISDDIVLKSIDLLKSVVTSKVLLADSKILLVENSRIHLLNDLIRLSVFDYRSYILPLLKRFLREELEGIVDMDAKAKLAALEEELLTEEKKRKEKKSGPKKKKHRSNKRTSASKSSHLDQDDPQESSINLEPGVSLLKMVDEDSIEPEERGRQETSSNTNNHEEAIKDLKNMPTKDSLSEDATRYRSAVDMTLKALLNIKVLQEDLVHNRQPFHGNLEEQVPYALQNLFSAIVSEQIAEEGLYSYLLSNLLASLEGVHSMSSDAADVVVAILEFFHCWKSPERESLVTRLFTLAEYERMSCKKCKRKPNYPEQSSYGIVMAANSIRNLKCAFGNIKFEDILKMGRMKDGMICDVKTGGCGDINFVLHTISRCPPIFTIVLEWVKNETEKDISETTKALDWEIDISRVYEGLEESNIKYRLVSMIGCVVEGEYICMAYKKNRWVSLRHEALAEEVVGNWNNVVRFCGERKVRPEILFYEAFQWPNKWQKLISRKYQYENLAFM
ncbi:putative transcription factor C2H2 family [Arabidopsis thaliana]